MDGKEFPRLMKTLCIMLAIVAVLGIIAIVVTNSNDKFDTANYYTKTIKVEKGDTLWELGSMYKAEGDNIRDWIKAVKDHNYMTGSGLTAGDYIIIYIAK